MRANERNTEHFKWQQANASSSSSKESHIPAAHRDTKPIIKENLILALKQIENRPWHNTKDQYWIRVSSEDKESAEHRLLSAGLIYSSSKIKDSTDYCIIIKAEDAVCLLGDKYQPKATKKL